LLIRFDKSALKNFALSEVFVYGYKTGFVKEILSRIIHNLRQVIHNELLINHKILVFIRFEFINMYAFVGMRSHKSLNEKFI